MANDWHWRSPEFDNVSKECKDLIKKLLVKSPKKRYTADKALKHKWFRYAKDPNNHVLDDKVLNRLVTYKG